MSCLLSACCDGAKCCIYNEKLHVERVGHVNDSSPARRSGGALRGLLALPSAPQDKSCPEAKDLPRPSLVLLFPTVRAGKLVRPELAKLLPGVGGRATALYQPTTAPSWIYISLTSTLVLYFLVPFDYI